MGMKPRQYHAMGQTPPEDGKWDYDRDQNSGVPASGARPPGERTQFERSRRELGGDRYPSILQGVINPQEAANQIARVDKRNDEMDRTGYPRSKYQAGTGLYKMKKK